MVRGTKFVLVSKFFSDIKYRYKGIYCTSRILYGTNSIIAYEGKDKQIIKNREYI